MVTYKKISQNDNVTIYEYYPEGDISEPGVIEFVDGKYSRLVKRSKNDVQTIYASHAWRSIERTKQEEGVAVLF